MDDASALAIFRKGAALVVVTYARNIATSLPRGEGAGCLSWAGRGQGTYWRSVRWVICACGAYWRYCSTEGSACAVPYTLPCWRVLAFAGEGWYVLACVL